jgi:hypothetical protein
VASAARLAARLRREQRTIAADALADAYAAVGDFDSAESLALGCRQAQGPIAVLTCGNVRAGEANRTLMPSLEGSDYVDRDLH